VRHINDKRGRGGAHYSFYLHITQLLLLLSLLLDPFALSFCIESSTDSSSSIRQSVYSVHCLNVFSTRSNGAILFIRAVSIGSNKSEEKEEEKEGRRGAIN
jgi:hypothetical protein